MRSGYLSYHERSGLRVRERLVMHLLQTIQTFLTYRSISFKVQSHYLAGLEMTASDSAVPDSLCTGLSIRTRLSSLLQRKCILLEAIQKFRDLE